MFSETACGHIVAGVGLGHDGCSSVLTLFSFYGIASSQASQFVLFNMLPWLKIGS